MIRIFTFAHRRPDFIPLQVESFEKYLRDDYDLTIFNNAALDRDRARHSEIDKICHDLGVSVVDVSRDPELVARCQKLESVPLFDHDGEYSNPNIACAYPLCWAWEKIITNSSSPICIIDSDMFLTRSIRFTDYLQNHQLCFVPMTRPTGITYMWNALVLADLPKLPDARALNWWCGTVGDYSVDVGGQTHFYLKAHPELAIMEIISERVDDEKETGHELLWLGGIPILHYLRGSNWNNQSEEYHRKKTDWLKWMLK